MKLITYKFLGLLLPLALALSARTQSLSPGTVASGGGSSSAGGVQLNWTLGESFNNALFGNNQALTQGFQQPELQVWTGQVVSPSVAGTQVSIPYLASGITSATNVYTAELSDKNGSFASPVVLGTITAKDNNSIVATIPANTPAGIGYRIRVKSSLPAFTGVDNGSDVEIKAPVAVALFTKTNNTCHNGTTGQITVKATGGIPAYTFAITAGPTVNTSGATNGVFTNLAAGLYTITAADARGNTATVSNIVITEPGTTPDVTLSVADFTDQFFPATGSKVTLLFQVVEQGGNPALNSLISLTKQSGYTFSLVAAPTVNIAGIEYPLDNSRWTADNSSPTFFNISMNNGQQVACSQTVYLAVELTRTTPSKANFTMTGRIRNVTGEANNTNNSTIIGLVGQ